MRVLVSRGLLVPPLVCGALVCGALVFGPVGTATAARLAAAPEPDLDDFFDALEAEIDGLLAKEEADVDALIAKEETGIRAVAGHPMSMSDFCQPWSSPSSMLEACGTGCTRMSSGVCGPSGRRMRGSTGGSSRRC